MPRTKHIINIHTSAGTSEPIGANLYLGEIAVQHTSGSPALWIKMGDSEESNIYEKFIGETEILDLLNSDIILGDSYTYSGIPYVNSATTLAEAYSALTKEVLDNEYVVSAALNNLNDRVTNVSGYVNEVEDAVEGLIANEELVADILEDLDDRIVELSGSSANYASQSDLDAVSALTFVLSGDLESISSVTIAHVENAEIHLPTVTSSDDGKILKVVDDEWSAVTPNVIYAGTTEPLPSLGNEGDVYLQTSPVIIYETDGTTGLLGHNQSSLDNHWQLENLDLSSYSYLKCYFAAGSASGDARTPAVIVDVILDNAAVGPTGYIGSIQTCLPFNRNREYLVSCAVDTTKTKFQVIHQNTLWDVTTSDANNNGRYLYKIEGYI